MYGRYHYHLHLNPLKRLVYGILGGPRISDWVRFLNVRRELKSLESPIPKRILDAGCGLGFYSLLMAEKFPEAAISALDEDKSLVDGLQRTARSMGIRSIEPVVADLTAYLPEHKFGLICCVDVMEHIPDHDKVFGRFSEWLEPGGILILHVPQKNQKFLFIKRTHGGEDPHCREGYDLSELSGMMGSKGLRILRHKNTFDQPAALAVELDEIFWKKRLYPFWLVLYPLLLAAAAWDYWRQGKQGQGILVVARKNG